MNHSFKWTFLIVLIITVTVTTGVAQEKSEQRLQFEGWTLSAQPYRGPEHESIPVNVISLAIKDTGYEFKITNLVLRNRSSKTVSGIEINWRLVKEKTNGITVLKKGFYNDRIFPNGLSAGEELALKFPVISISKIILSGEELRGDYRIEVTVTNVFYTDKTSWKPRRLVKQI